MLKVRLFITALAVVVIGIYLFPHHVALADCQITGGSGGNDTVTCDSTPQDTDGISTGGGNDTVTVESPATVSRSDGGNTIDMSTGNDTLYNNGSITSTADAVHMGTGVDLLENRGTIRGEDDGTWCVPNSGQTCTIRNFNSITADQESVDVAGRGGTFILENAGTVRSDNQEAVHMAGSNSYTTTVYQINNTGSIRSPQRHAIEGSWGQLIVENSGTIDSRQRTIIAGGRHDSVTNSGTIDSDTDAALDLNSGRDTVTNTGTISAAATSSYESVIELGDGFDILTASPTSVIRQTGVGTAIEGNFGSDTITIQGGVVQGTIYGDALGSSSQGTGEGAADWDVLIFELNGTQSEIDAFRAQVQSQSPDNGSATWRGNTYVWQRFEEIRLILNNANVPTATPTSSPSPTPTRTPTFTPSPTIQPGSALPPGYYEDNSGVITYTGTWAHYGNAQASGGGYTRTNTVGSQAAFSFVGTRLTIFRTMATSRGPMDVCIDGACQTISNDSSTTVYTVPVSFDVAAGTHIVVIAYLGSEYVDIDAIQIEEGTVPPATNTPGPTNTPGTGTGLAPGYYEDNSGVITYTGAWFFYSNAQASGGGYTRTNDANAQAAFSFTGTRLTIFRTMATSRGPMEVCIDGACQTISNDSSTTVYTVPVSFDVAAGTHSVVISHMGQEYIDIDAIQIE